MNRLGFKVATVTVVPWTALGFSIDLRPLNVSPDALRPAGRAALDSSSWGRRCDLPLLAVMLPSDTSKWGDLPDFPALWDKASHLQAQALWGEASKPVEETNKRIVFGKQQEMIDQ